MYDFATRIADEYLMALAISVDDTCPEAGEIDESSIDPICSDECSFSGDGVCDDGGTSAEFATCSLGTDCSDCGIRIDADLDGYDEEQDCNDSDASIHPDAMESLFEDGLDSDCDGEDGGYPVFPDLDF